MVLAVVLVVAGLLNRDATVLMLGSTMLGTQPLLAARKEPPPQ